MNLKNVSFKTKTNTVFVIIITLFIVSLTISYTAMNTLTKEYDRTLKEEMGVHTDIKNLAILMLQARRNEKDFILRKKEKYVKQHKETTDKMLATLNKDHEIFAQVASEEVYALAVKDITHYNQEFTDLVRRYRDEGDSKTGIRGKMRSHAHNIEKNIKKWNLSPEFTIQLLNMRRREKDYLLRRDPKYLAKAKNDASKLRKLLNNSDLTTDESNVIRKDLSAYLSLFNEAIINYDYIVKDIASFRKDIHHFEGYLKETDKKITQMIFDKTEELHALKENRLALLVVISLISITAILFVALFLTKVANKFTVLANNLKGTSDATTSCSTDVKGASHRVSEATVQQASAIQETVATLDEIRAMVNKSVNNANESATCANNSHQIATEGKGTVKQVIGAIGDISDANKQIMTQMNQNNDQLENIVKIITEISSKTSIINDIVFQTKLLSFNASVEAARAGEHGKGFAVVAEEIGSLAQMSGTASMEIEEMLGESVQKVQEISDQTKENVTKLTVLGKEKTENAVLVANQCDQKLDEIVVNAEEVKTMVNEINHAAKEQAVGVGNIAEAMNELDQATHVNSDIATQTSDLSIKLDGEAENLKDVVLQLEVEILGETA